MQRRIFLSATAVLPPIAAPLKGTVDRLPQSENRLVAMPTYLVVPGSITSPQVAGKPVRNKLLQRMSVPVDGTDGVGVNKASVTTADIIASNGVIQ